jgi:hypothetical protein
MSAPEKPIRLADRLRRLVALGSAAMVFALTIFAASPEAHGILHEDKDCPGHGHATSEPDHSCAVVLFAGGISLPVGPLFVTPPIAVPAGISPVTAAEVFLISPRYLRHPERGPPLSGVS